MENSHNTCILNVTLKKNEKKEKLNNIDIAPAILCEYFPKNDKKRGCFVAVSIGDIAAVGWSMCNINAGDTFNKQKARDMAIGRAKALIVRNNAVNQTMIPTSIDISYWEFVNRAKMYYKDKKFITSIDKKIPSSNG